MVEIRALFGLQGYKLKFQLAVMLISGQGLIALFFGYFILILMVIVVCKTITAFMQDPCK